MSSTEELYGISLGDNFATCVAMSLLWGETSPITLLRIMVLNRIHARIFYRRVAVNETILGCNFFLLMIPQTSFSAAKTDALMLLKHLDVTIFFSSFGLKHFRKGRLLKDIGDYVFSQEDNRAEAMEKDRS
ncbi:hypothetical protein [Pectobacterium sp. B2J-2]|uniref:hypothetical protein n=1 Tax=Pectobacterium sp. B2J-2 TaxID=3385372 RepID=UPI0038FCF55A